MWLLSLEQASTTSGEFLVAKAKATHLKINRLGAPILEGIPDHQPDWGVLECSTGPPNHTRGGLEASCKALEEELHDAHKILQACEVIFEGQNAQLIIQNIAVGKLKVALVEKEKGTKSDCSI
jgi:hypothetical protein